ncbi:MAG: adenosine deaminase [Bacilli bacterium]|nr:adenosine deaminase [Bacilli bacterium]
MIKKIELHLHLDGSIREETANEILGKKCNLKAKDKCEDLNEYLEKFEIPSIILQTKENLERVAYELALDLKKDNVIYAEIRFAPLKHLNGGLSLDEVITSVLNGLSKVDIETNLILCMMRNDSFNDNKKVIDLAHKYGFPIDLAGAEAIYKTKDFKELFKYAKSINVPFTIHAGEADGYESIKAAIDFGASRLGHGIKIIDYPDLINEVKEKGITLEVCPTSNVQTNAVNILKDHPIKKLYDMNVNVCINTDNRTVSNITLEDEYNKLKETFNFTNEDFLKMNLMAIEASFAQDKEKLKTKLRGE